MAAEGSLDRASQPLERRRLGPVVATMAYLWSATMVFAGFLSAHFVLRAEAATWPPPGQPRLPFGISTFNMGVLLASGVLVVLAWRASELQRAARYLRWAAGVGGLFLLVQGFEWIRMLDHGITVASGTYGATFYALVATHGLHVLGGFLILLATATGGRLTRPRKMACCLYWGFVVMVWPPLYGVLYHL